MENVELKEIKEVKKTEKEWGEDHINILVEWADKALCYKWLHSKAHAGYSRSHAWFTIPVIIMSTIAGTANFAQEKFPEDMRQYASMAIGTINLCSGIITTVQQYLKISELNEAHRVAYIGWDKFYRNTKVELSKSQEDRLPVSQMMKYCKEEFDRLMETSPSISDDIVKEFMKTFSIDDASSLGIDKNKKYKDFINIKKPEICDSLETTRSSVFKNPINIKELKIDIKSPSSKNDKIKDEIHKKVKDIIERFEKETYRKPSTNEILNELEDDDTIEIHADMIEKILTLSTRN